MKTRIAAGLVMFGALSVRALAGTEIFADPAAGAGVLALGTGGLVALRHSLMKR